MSNSYTSTAFYVHKSNWGNSNLFPDIIYIDTCAIRDIFEKRTHGILMDQYLQELNNQDGMIIWSQNVIDELIDFLNVDEYKKLAKNNGLSQDEFKKAENNATRHDYEIIGENIYNRLGVITNYLEQFGVQTDNDFHDVVNIGKQLHTKYGGNRKDAYHVADSLLSGVNNILTQDGGFLRYPNLNVFGASKKMKDNYVSAQQHLDYIDIKKLLDLETEGTKLEIKEDSAKDAS